MSQMTKDGWKILKPRLSYEYQSPKNAKCKIVTLFFGQGLLFMASVEFEPDRKIKTGLGSTSTPSSKHQNR